jgi:EAL domain-containing protein (putative c-di-GMP-specific phosphodiesterase class I)
LHLSAVAEGVEDLQQLECLRGLGCQIVQGYLVSRPVPAEQVIALLERDWRQAFGQA